jgi:predicted nucleic acid-binding protein
VNVFLDTNVVLDVFAHRQPFYADSAKVWALAERGQVRGLISALSMTNLYYVVRKLASRLEATEMLKAVRACVGLAPCDASVLNQAIDAEFGDFEDAVQYFSARAAAADVLVTRNTVHFPEDGNLPAMTPTAFLAAHSFG